jgi:hypothetical protein
MAFDTTRATVLATLADLSLDGLPAALTRAVTAYVGALGLQVPGPPPAPQAIIEAAAAKALADAARTGSDTIRIDPSPVTAARAAEALHLDQAAITRAVRDAAPLMLCQTVDSHRAQITKALQVRHAAILGELVPAARRLPPGITDRQALDAGGHVREDFIASRDLAAQAERLRAVLVDVEDVPGRGPLPSLLERCLAYLRIPVLYEAAPSEPFGQPGTLEFYRRLGRETEPGDWWLPTRAELHARAVELAEQRRADEVAQLPRGATVW